MSGSIGASSLVKHVTSATNKNIQNVANLSKTLDFTDPASMSKMQFALMKMNMGIEMEAAMIKSFEDMIKSVIQRI